MSSDWPISPKRERLCRRSRGCGSVVDSQSVEEETREPSELFTENTPLLPGAIPRATEDETDNATIVLCEELRYLAKSSWPVLISNLFEYTSVIAVVSIGHISTNHLAAAALGSTTASLTGFGVVFGFCSALDTVLPSAWTSSTPQLVGLWTQRMAVVQFITLIPVAVLWIYAEPLLLLLRQDPEISKLAALYLRWMTLCLPTRAFNTFARRYFQSQGRFTIPARIIVVEALSDVIFNYLLVWGPKSVRLGFIGSPIASAIAIAFTSMLYIIYGLFFVPKTAWHPISMRMFEELGYLTRLGFAGYCEVASEWFAWEFSTIAASFLGPAAMASQSVATVLCSIAWQSLSALGTTVSVRIGNHLGESQAVHAKFSSYAALLLALCSSTIWSTTYLVFRKSLAKLFNNDPEVISLVASLTPLVALAQLIDGVCTVMTGVLRAQEKQLIGSLLNISGYYIIGIPFGLWLTFGCHFGLNGTWIGLNVALAYISIGTLLVCMKSDWNEEQKKVSNRLVANQKFMIVNDA